MLARGAERRPRPHDRIAPAAPSPNSAAATRLLFDLASRRKESAHNSTTRHSMRSPGRPAPGPPPAPARSRRRRSRAQRSAAAARRGEPHTLDQQRVEAGGRDPGRRDPDDRVDAHAEPARSSSRMAVLSSSSSALASRAGCARPSRALVVPFDRHAGIARADAGVGEHRQQPLQHRSPAEQQLDALGSRRPGRADRPGPRSRC